MTTLTPAPSFHLTPALSPALRQVVDDADLLTTLVEGFGSPLNVVLPAQLGANVAACRRALEGQAGLAHRIFLAHKPNRSAAIVRQAALEAIGLDVASEGELRSGLAAGFPGHRIEATGPKNPAFLRLALQHGVLINVDNAVELDQVDAARRALGLSDPAEVMIRISGVTRNGRPASELDTKFGVPAEDVPALLRRLVELRDAVRLRGFAFHLPFSSGRERARAAETLLDLHIEAIRMGLTPSAVNVGGGFKVNYLQDADEWNAYVSGLKAGLLAQGPSLSWNGTGFGMWAENGSIAGAAQLASFAHAELMEAELAAFLATPMTRHGGRDLGTFLAENLVELHVEPGRAMYDQLGLTAARVNFTKPTARGEWLVGLDMNRSNLDVVDREFFVDPILIPRSGAGTPQPGADPVGVYFGGNLCLPGDLILRHKTFLDRLPEAGDLVVFPNTAGYFMDFTESETLLQRVAPKVAVAPGRRGLSWWRDEDYVPVGPGEAS